MRGRCAPMRWATAGVKTVVSAPVSRRRVTAAPLANKVTIGALRRVATVVSPSRIALHPPVPSAAYCIRAASAIRSPKESAETNVPATSAPLSHLLIDKPVHQLGVEQSHRGDISQSLVQAGENDRSVKLPPSPCFRFRVGANSRHLGGGRSGAGACASRPPKERCGSEGDAANDRAQRNEVGLRGSRRRQACLCLYPRLGMRSLILCATNRAFLPAAPRVVLGSAGAWRKR